MILFNSLYITPLEPLAREIGYYSITAIIGVYVGYKMILWFLDLWKGKEEREKY